MNVALRRRTEVEPRQSARRVFDAVAPVLGALRDDGALGAWHFMRKPPDLRVRFAVADHALERARSELTAAAEPLQGEAIEHVFFSVYEPETERFGGEAAMRLAHEYFTVDAEQWLVLDRLERDGERRSASEPLCMAILDDLFVRAVDDGAEVFDVWVNLTRIAPRADADAPLPEVRRMALESIHGEVGEAERQVIETYVGANGALAAELAKIWSAGALGTGPRAYLAMLGSFVLHRHGLAGPRWAPWAAAMAAAWDPRARLIDGQPGAAEKDASAGVKDALAATSAGDDA